jgi:superfamily II DNA/RNA helicase
MQLIFFSFINLRSSRDRDTRQYKLHANGKAEIRHFYQCNDIKMIGEALPSPFLNYSDINLNKMFRRFYDLMEKLQKYQELELPTPLQSQVIPMILSRRNFCAVSQRAEDRVLAYLIPAIMYICWSRKRTNAKVGNGPMLAILAPTVEMCVQIERVASFFGGFLDVENSMVVDMSPSDAREFFGKPKSLAMRENVFKPYVDIVIATPKRFLHLSEFLHVHDVINVP